MATEYAQHAPAAPVSYRASGALLYPEQMSTFDPDPAIATKQAVVWLASRTTALAFYGLLGLEVGIAMMLGGAPATVEEHFGPWIRYALGAPATLGGILLLASVVMGDRTLRGWWSALAGTATMTMWGLAMSVTFVATALENGIELLGFNDVATLGVSRLYVPLVYHNLFLLLALHLVTIVRLGRPKR